MQVLVADDDRVTSTQVAGLLHAWGYEVRFARDGDEAIACLLNADAPRIALVDWTMPGQSGLEVCRQVRAKGPREYTYLIMVTARGERGDILQGLNAGADDYLVKPIFPAELRARVEVGKRIADLQEQLVQALKSAEYQAGHDVLTGLWNRGAIFEQLRATLARAERQGHPVGMLLTDIDYFKTVNDTRGHQVGDAAIRHTADILKSCVRSYDLVGRYGGDEFLIIAPDCESPDLAQIGQRIVDRIAQTPLVLAGGVIPLSVSVGAALACDTASRQEAVLVGAADASLYEAKNAGRGRMFQQVLPPQTAAASMAAAADNSSLSLPHCGE